MGPHVVYHHSLSLDPLGLFLPPRLSEFKGFAEVQVGLRAWGWGAVSEEKDTASS